jgi:hypothetical protein
MRPLDVPVVDKSKVPTKQYGEYVLKYSSVKDSVYIVSAWHGDTKVGQAHWRNQPYEDGYTVRYLWILPEHQRKGIGAELWLFGVELAEGKYEGVKPTMPTVGIGPETSESGEAFIQYLNL